MAKNIADEMGRLKVKMDELAQKYEDLRLKLIDSGEERVDGRSYYATVTHSEVSRCDYKGLVEKIQPSKRLRNQFTTVEDRTTVYVRELVTEPKVAAMIRRD